MGLVLKYLIFLFIFAFSGCATFKDLCDQKCREVYNIEGVKKENIFGVLNNKEYKNGFSCSCYTRNYSYCVIK